MISSALRRDFFPIKLSSRENEQSVRETPHVYLGPSRDVERKRVLLVDDICVTKPVSIGRDDLPTESEWPP